MALSRPFLRLWVLETLVLGTLEISVGKISRDFTPLATGNPSWLRLSERTQDVHPNPGSSSPTHAVSRSGPQIPTSRCLIRALARVRVVQLHAGTSELSPAR